MFKRRYRKRSGKLRRKRTMRLRRRSFRRFPRQLGYRDEYKMEKVVLNIPCTFIDNPPLGTTLSATVLCTVSGTIPAVTVLNTNKFGVFD